MSIGLKVLEDNVVEKHAVPTADATTNVYMRDVVGIKTDAAVATVGTTKTIMAYVKGLFSHVTKPAANSSDNTYMSDVVGDKTDTYVTAVGTTKSVIAYLKGILSTNVTVTGTIAQDGATGTPNVVDVSTSADANTFGSWTALDAAAAANCWLSTVTVTTTTGAAVSWCVEIGTGASPSTVARFSAYQAYTSAAGVYPTTVYTFSKPIYVASGTAISARASDSQAAANHYFIGLSWYVGL